MVVGKRPMEKSGCDPADIEFLLAHKYSLIRDLPAKTLFNTLKDCNQNHEEGEDWARRVLDLYKESKSPCRAQVPVEAVAVHTGWINDILTG